MSAINNISLYIPHIFTNYSKENVAKVFETLKIGKVKNIDFISKMGNDFKPFNAAYIHFEYWYDNIGATNFQEKVLHKSPAKLMYDEPWFWLVLENKGKKIVSGDRKKCLDIREFFGGGAILNKGFITPENKGKKIVSGDRKKCLDIREFFGGGAILNKGFITPEKTTDIETTPRTPTKGKNSETFDKDNNVVFNMNNSFEEQEYTQMMDEMTECEIAMEEEDQCLISIDGRYVQELEQANAELRIQLAQMHNAYYAECIKSQSLAQALQIVNK